MKIKFWNLGSIKEAELDLRPLTVIIGPNNSNKTYIAYSIYGLWKQFNSDSIARLYISDTLESKVYAKQSQQDDNIWLLDIDDNFCNLFNKYTKEISGKFNRNILDVFFQDSSRKIFEKTHYLLIISIEQIHKAIKELSCLEKDRLPISLSNVKYDNHKVFFYLNEYEKQKNPFMAIINGRTLTQTVFKWLETNIFSFSLPLPAERNTFINTYKILANRRFNLLKNAHRDSFSYRNFTTQRQLDLLREQGDIRYPQPVEDFLDFLSDVELENKPEPKSDNKNEFQKLADQIEEHIQNKNKTKFKDTKFGGKEIKISVKRGLEIDLYNASSSIKQLAPLLLYLRYRAKAGDFLVIDEPEMNLHPESQVKLLEALAILINLGVRVLLTTHSPYLMAHLNNIVNGNHQDQEILEAQAQSLYLQDSQAFLKMEQVSAYEMKNNQLISLHDPDYGIRWDTLSDVSVDVQQKFFAIYEAGQKSKDTEA
jgi:predicted ATPase